MAHNAQPLPASQKLVRLAMQFVSPVKQDMHIQPKARRASVDKEQSAGSRLPYSRHWDDTTILTRDGLLIQIIHIVGLPFETVDTDEINYRKAIRDGALKATANSRFALYHHIVRRRVVPQMSGEFPDPFSKSLDDTWQRNLSGKTLYVNDLYLTLVRRPLSGRVGLFDKAIAAFTDGLNNSVAQQEAAIAIEQRALSAATMTLLASLATYDARVLSVYDTAFGPCSEPLEFLSSLYNGETRPIQLPRADLSEYLPYRRVSFGADSLELSKVGAQERSFAAIVSIKDYPPQTSPGMLDDLLRLPHELVISQSFAFVDRQGSLDRMNMALRRMRAADDDAVSLRAGLNAAKDDVSAGRAAFGEHHLTIMVRARSLKAVDEAVAEVMSSLTDIGIIAVREDVNLEPAFWAQFPGNFKDIARRAIISTSNFAGFASGHNFPTGKARNNHWGEAVTLLETTSAGPYFFNFHKNDLGNFTIIGPSGSGKTVVLNFLLAQARKYDPRIVFFDKDRGAEIFLRAIGGRYDSIRPGEPTGFNPLQLPDNPANRTFLSEWIEQLVSTPGQQLSPDDMLQISDAVDANYAQQPGFRQLTYFAELFRGDRRPNSADLAAKLRSWWGEGEHAWLFDNAADALDLDARVVGFDMTQILDEPRLRTPAMMYLFHRVEERLDGTPSLLIIDEGWKALDDEVFLRRIKDWEKTIRKRNGVVGFATQSAQDALESKIAPAIIEQSATQIFMSNPRAQRKDYCDGFGLTDHELGLVQSLPDTSHCFLIKHGTDSVVARLNLTGEADILKVLSGRESAVRMLDTLRRDLGEDPAIWLPRLLESV